MVVLELVKLKNPKNFDLKTYSKKRELLLKRWTKKSPNIIKVYIQSFLCGVLDICEESGHIKISSQSELILQQTFDRDNEGGWINIDKITRVVPNYQK